MAPQLSSNQELLCDPLRQKYCDILKSNGILDEVDEIVMTEPPELKGEHMASCTVYVKVTFKDEGKKPKNLFVKKFPNNEAHIAFTKKMRIMEKESFFFMIFLPQLREFCKKYKGCEDLLHFFPKCLHGDDEMIVMENLVLDDTWFMLDKEARQDLHAAKMVLTNLARYHAATYAYIQEECGGSDKFRENNELACYEAFIMDAFPGMEEMFDNSVVNCLRILETFSVPGGDEAKETLTGFLGGKIYPLMKTLISPNTEDKLLVLNHGDCWNNNMLFKRDEETGKINNHIFVDLQITRFCSPSIDLAYFLYTSVKHEIRRTHFKELMSHFFNAFTETLEKFQHKCPVVFEEFLEDYKTKSQVGFFIGLSFMSAIGSLKDIDVEQMPEDPQEMMEMFNTAIHNWLEKNPEKSKEIAHDIVAVVKEDAKLRGCE